MEEYIKLLENILKIKIVLSFGELKGTKMGEADLKNGTITINKNNDTFTTLFSLAHEARHIYQYKYDRARCIEDMQDYIDGKDGMGQYVEMDSNAFAYFLFTNVFGLRPTLNLSYDGFDTVYNRICKQYQDLRVDRNIINKICDTFGLPNLNKRKFISNWLK